MKTIKFYIVLSLVLVLAAVTSAFAASIGEINTQASGNHGIHYQVNIHSSYEKTLCNTYLIEIRDGQRQLVAPPQRYISGVTRYDFYERGPASGVRVASLVLATYGQHYVCDVELFTTPAVMRGPYLNGQTYRFDLYPKAQPSKP
jgi:hypothetical protein